MVSVAQLVAAPGCGLGGRGFKSHRSPHYNSIKAFQAVGLKRLFLLFPQAPANFFSNKVEFRQFEKMQGHHVENSPEHDKGKYQDQLYGNGTLQEGGGPAFDPPETGGHDHGA